MILLGGAIALGERVPWPDSLSEGAIDWLVGRTQRRLALAPQHYAADFAQAMNSFPIAVDADAANSQHYELPPEFFKIVLGPQLKYSCCLFADPGMNLAEAEDYALRVTAQNAGLEDGQNILELGCGWGSLSLWMARHLPNARITAVSNSRVQRDYIETEKARQGLASIEVITADMNSFETNRRFDRIVSVEMFEHMSNWPELLRRLHSLLTPEGRLFIHVFAHLSCPYRFDHGDDADWIGQHFFTGGLMPSHGLIRECGREFIVEAEWRWSGDHYRRTAEAWLANFDASEDAIDGVLRRVYGRRSRLWKRRWRLFFLATARLFGFDHGKPWGVSHYRLAPD